MAYVEPKNEATRQIVRVCGMFLNENNYKIGHFCEEAAKTPREIKLFYDPKDEVPTEAELFAACEAHVKAHAWRLERIWVEFPYVNFNKPYEPQKAVIAAKMAEFGI
jgi:phosphopantetheinyl transferase (holo-ACP synthase)